MAEIFEKIKLYTRFRVIFPALVALNVALFLAGQAAKEPRSDWTNIKIPMRQID